MKGKYYALNFPLRDGICDENYKSVFEPVSLQLLWLYSSNEKKCAKGDTTSDGILRPFSYRIAMWYRLSVWR